MPNIKTYFARVARSTSGPSRREEPINAGYSTPTTTRTRSMRTPVTTGSKLTKNYTTPKTTRRSLQSPANSGRTRHYTKPTLIYRPLELDTESSSESSEDILRNRAHRAAIQQTPLCLPPAPTSAAPAPTPVAPAPEPGPTTVDDEDDEIQIIKVTKKPSKPSRTPTTTNPAKRRKTHHQEDAQDNIPNHRTSPPEEPHAPKVIENKPIEIVQGSQCMTPPITPEKKAKESEARETEKVLVPEVKLPTFVPGNCDIEEIMRRYGIKKNPNPGVTASRQSEAV